MRSPATTPIRWFFRFCRDATEVRAPARGLSHGFRLVVAALALGFTALAARAGEFGVSPLRIDLDRSTRSAVITVSNDGDAPLAFQIRAFEWTQDASGSDQYQETGDLVYFPQQLQIPPRENRVVRIGYRNPAVGSERAYRVFVEERIDPKLAPRTGTQVGVALAVRFGVPVFLRPVASETRGTVTELAAGGGKAQALVSNSGPVHFRITSVRFVALGAGGETAFEQTIDGWYLLAGNARRYSAAFPADACRKARTLRVEVVAENLKLESQQPVSPGSCS